MRLHSIWGLMRMSTTPQTGSSVVCAAVRCHVTARGRRSKSTCSSAGSRPASPERRALNSLPVMFPTIDDVLEEARRRLVRATPEQAAAELAHGTLLVDTRTAAQRAEQGEIP